MSKTLMVQGTASDAGKTLLVTALCRAFVRRGLKVAPFKPQNMALNSAVTLDGGEIGRAQALQAQACGLEPHTDFNPVLLKPNTDTGAQVIVHGRAIGNRDARDYHDYKPTAMAAVLESHGRLQAQYELIMVEGAGSPAEINLRDKDIANMGFAEAVDCPVILVADIDKGGVFAQLVGTLELLSESERSRIKGLVINRFRGDVSLLTPGIAWLEERTGKPVLGVLPYLHGLHLDDEDGLSGGLHWAAEESSERPLRVIVPLTPRISNHTDFDALRHHPRVQLDFIAEGQAIPPADLICLPGSKSVRADLAWLRANGWERAIQTHLRYGGRLIAICGGYQMLGKGIADPLGLEGEAGAAPGLGLLDFDTTLEAEKQLKRVSGRLRLAGKPRVDGYEIHAGVSEGPALENPAAQLDNGLSDGVISADGQILSSYLHGLFDHPEACAALLGWAGLAPDDALPPDYRALREAAIERLADALDEHLDMQALGALLE